MNAREVAKLWLKYKKKYEPSANAMILFIDTETKWGLVRYHRNYKTVHFCPGLTKHLCTTFSTTTTCTECETLILEKTKKLIEERRKFLENMMGIG